MLFFFYGTLIAGSGNSVAREVHLGLRDLGPATVRGKLHAIPDPQGWYPALVPGDSEVSGRLYEAADGFGPGSLAALDNWEDYDPADPARSLYVRSCIEAVARDGAIVRASCYGYNQPIPADAAEIVSGDFAAFLLAGSHRAFGS